MPNYKAIKISKGQGGWGGPLVVEPTEQKRYIVSVTGGGIHPVAQEIANLTNGVAVDGFKNPVETDEMACVVIDCGGTARCGVYPKMGVLTININATSPSGPLMAYIREDNFVSGVQVKDLGGKVSTDEVSTAQKSIPYANGNEHKKTVSELKHEAREKVRSMQGDKDKDRSNIITKIGRIMGDVVNVLYQAGRETMDMIIKNILPFMAFVSTLIGIILYTGIGDIIAKFISPLAGTLPGLLIISIVCAIPILSPLLGPGAVIAQVVGVLVGVEIGRGSVPPSLALPALFAINPQVGCDFVPVGLTLGEAKPQTIEIGVPAVLISRLFTGPLAVLLAYLLSFGLY